MKAVSIRQPWAHLIAEGRKTVEVRSWPTAYRGPLLVVVSKTFKHVRIRNAYDIDWSAVPMWRREDMGMAIATVDLVNCTTMAQEHEDAAFVECRPGLFAWTLARAQKIEPFPVVGRLGLFNVDLPSPAGLVMNAGR